jgi:hypothetical protein
MRRYVHKRISTTHQEKKDDITSHQSPSLAVSCTLPCTSDSTVISIYDACNEHRTTRELAFFIRHNLFSPRKCRNRSTGRMAKIDGSRWRMALIVRVYLSGMIVDLEYEE